MNFKNILSEFGGILFIILAVQLLSVMLVSPAMLHDQNLTAAAKEDFENPDSVSSIYSFLIQFIIGTIIFLLAVKLNLNVLLKLVFVGIVSLNTMVVVNLLLHEIVPYSEILSTAIGLISMILLFVYPVWYVIAPIGILVCSTSSGFLGSYISPFPITVLLVILIIVDHFAVNVSKYMITLADATVKHSLPLAFQIPLPTTNNEINHELHTEFIDSTETTSEDDGVTTFQLMGFGDAVFPATLAVSANVFIGSLAGGLTIIGTLIGGLYLAKEGLKGKPLPGLPYLNTGAIVGLLLGMVCYWII